MKRLNAINIELDDDTDDIYDEFDDFCDNFGNVFNDVEDILESVYIPEDMLLQIIYRLKYPLPWQLIHFIELKLKNVCKSWQVTIQNNVPNICNYFGIGLLHYMASINNADEIMRLNMEENYSLREADKLGYCPASYAVGSCAYNSAVRLKIAHALDTRHVTVRGLCNLIPDNKKNSPVWKLLIEENAKTIPTVSPTLFGNKLPTIPTNSFVFCNVESDNNSTPNDIEKTILSKLKQEKDFFEGHIFKNFLWLYDAKLFAVSDYSKIMIYAYKNWLIHAYWETLYNNKYPDLIASCSKYEINFNSSDEKGQTFLHMSVHNAPLLYCVKFLLQQKNINVNYASVRCGSALRTAISRDNIDTINLLLNAGANPYLNFEYWVKLDKFIELSPIMEIIKGKKPKLLEIIMEHDRLNDYKNILQHRTLKYNNKTLIHYAISIDSVECVKILLKIFDVNTLSGTGISLIEESISSKSIECVKLLIESGANLMGKNKFDLTLAHDAISANSPECLVILLKHIKDSAINTELIFYSIKLNRIQCLKALIDSGANINIKKIYHTDSMITPLIYAVYMNNIECTKMLLESGADIDMVGDIVIQKIIKNNYKQEIKYLQCSPLHIATHCRHIDILNLLIQYEPNKFLITKYQISIQDDQNSQPFISTIELNNKDIAKSTNYYCDLRLQ